MNLLIRYYHLNWFPLFITIVSLNLIMIWLSKTFLINEVVFYNAYSEQLTYDRSVELFEHLKSFSWISYAFTPLILLIKFSIISFVLYTGIIFKNFQNQISLKTVFKIVMASEIVFVSAGVFKFIWFYFFAGNYDFNDLNLFYPLSLINFFRNGEVVKYWIYPLQTINLFHLIYILAISFGIHKVCSIQKPDSERIVLISYIPALILWIILVMFLTIEV
jgi:hypothetical protein